MPRPFGIAVVHLVLGELAALHPQHLDPLDLFAGPRAARLVVLLDAGMDAAAAADALADVQGVAHEHARLGLGGIDGDLLAVLRGVAPFEPGARLGLFLVASSGGSSSGSARPIRWRPGHRRTGPSAPRCPSATTCSAFRRLSGSRGARLSGRCGRVCRRRLRRTFGWLAPWRDRQRGSR